MLLYGPYVVSSMPISALFKAAAAELIFNVPFY
jgi:hypothetical protein